MVPVYSLIFVRAPLVMQEVIALNQFVLGSTQQRSLLAQVMECVYSQILVNVEWIILESSAIFHCVLATTQPIQCHVVSETVSLLIRVIVYHLVLV